MKGCLGSLGCGFVLFMLIFIMGTCSDHDSRYDRERATERAAATGAKYKMQRALGEMKVQSRKLKDAGYSQKAIEDANWKIIEDTEKSFTPAERRVFYKAANKTFPSYSRE